MSTDIKIFQELGIHNFDDVVTYIKQSAGEMEEAFSTFMQLSEDLEGHLSFLERRTMKKKYENLKADLLRLDDNTHFLEVIQSLQQVVRFSPKLLIQYLSSYIQKYEGNDYQLFENVFVGENESLNQMIRGYMVNLTNDQRFLFQNYCHDRYENYHLLLPISCSTTNNSTSFPVLCLPAKRKVDVLDVHGNLTSKFKDLPYLETAMKDLVNYRIQHTELTQKQCLENLISDGGTKVYHI